MAVGLVSSACGAWFRAAFLSMARITKFNFDGRSISNPVPVAFGSTMRMGQLFLLLGIWNFVAQSTCFLHHGGV